LTRTLVAGFEVSTEESATTVYCIVGPHGSYSVTCQIPGGPSKSIGEVDL
jgi:hypothetical protein